MPEDAATPDELAAFLEAPGSYPHAPDDVELVATHLSLVALAGNRVYKAKKPVDLGFADFATLEKRRHFCEEEVRLNRRLCSGIYEGVAPIRRDDGGELTFADTGGAPVAYAVEMKRLPDGGFLDDRIDAGDAGEDELEQVAQRLAAFYREREPAPAVAEEGRAENLRRSTDENFEQTEAHAGTLLPGPAFEALRYYTNRFLDARAALLARRRAEGRVLEGHGDLRLEHVHLAPFGDEREDVCIYDCVEFSERLRAVDVASDVAFLAMDLDFHGRPGLALFFVRRMAALLDDPELPALVDFYKTHRAHVRAKVDAMQAEDDDLSPEKRAEQRERAQAHYRQALQYAATGSGPAVIAVMGRVGTGKSTQAHALAEALGSEVARSDRVRKQIAGVPPRERPDEATRAGLYSAEMTRKTYAALTDRALEAAEAKRPLVLDATFGKRAHRDALRDALAEADGAHRVPHCFVELTAPDDAIKERLGAREGTSPLSDARRSDFQMLAEGYEAPTALEDAFHFPACTEEGDPEATTTAILKHLVRLL